MLGWLWDKIMGQICHHKWMILDKSERVNAEHFRVGVNYREKCGNVKKEKL